jgi:hypothetical protein
MINQLRKELKTFHNLIVNDQTRKEIHFLLLMLLNDHNKWLKVFQDEVFLFQFVLLLMLIQNNKYVIYSYEEVFEVEIDLEV